LADISATFKKLDENLMFQAGVSYFVYFFNTSSRSFLTAASQSAVFIPQYFAQILLPRSVPNQLPCSLFTMIEPKAVRVRHGAALLARAAH
jgi:hypothetical protein